MEILGPGVSPHAAGSSHGPHHAITAPPRQDQSIPRKVCTPSILRTAAQKAFRKELDRLAVPLIFTAVPSDARAVWKLQPCSFYSFYSFNSLTNVRFVTYGKGVDVLLMHYLFF
jgi:hypothetical protein